MFDDFLDFLSIFIIATSTIYVLWELYNRPDGVQRAILFGLIWGCGPRVFTYSLLDEIVLSLVTAYMWLFRRNKLRAIVEELRRHKVYWMPTVICLFLAVHSLFSLFILEDPRMVKWTLVFVSAPFIFALVPRWLSGCDNPEGAPVGYVTVHLSLYFLVYILQGLAGEIFIGEWGRFHTQDLYWQGSSLAVMPVMVFFAAYYFLPKQFMHDLKRTLYIAAPVVFCAFFYDSRILQLLLVCCPVAGLIIHVAGYRHWIAILASFLVGFVVNVYFDNYDVSPHLYVKTVKANLGYDREQIRDANKLSSVRFCIEYVKISSEDLFWECEKKSEMSASESTSNKFVSAFDQKEIQRTDKGIGKSAFDQKEIESTDKGIGKILFESRVFGVQKKKDIEALKYGVLSLTNSVNLIHPLENDVDRSLQLLAGVEATLDAPKAINSIFGTGFYSHRYTIGPWITKNYTEALPGYSDRSIESDQSESELAIFRTTALTGFIVDTGIAGVLLFFSAVLSTAYFAIRSGLRLFFSGGCCAFISLAWTYSNYSFENALWFLLMFIVVGFCEDVVSKQQRCMEST